MSGAPPVVDPAPFDLGAREAEVAVLCLHGLTGTPYEVRSLGEAAAGAGLRAFGPVLPGHNETPEALARRRYTEWLDAVRDAVRSLRTEHARVYAAGLSMGGLLSLSLAAEARVDAVVAVGTPLRLRAPIPQLVPIAKRLVPFLSKKTGSDIRDAAARARHPGYPVMPLASVQELVRLQRWLRPRIASIRVPTLVAHGVHDRTAAPGDAERLHASISGSELVWLERSAHVVPVDHDGPELARRAVEFFLRLG